MYFLLKHFVSLCCSNEVSDRYLRIIKYEKILQNYEFSKTFKNSWWFTCSLKFYLAVIQHNNFWSHMYVTSVQTQSNVFKVVNLYVPIKKFIVYKSFWFWTINSCPLRDWTLSKLTDNRTYHKQYATYNMFIRTFYQIFLPLS